MTKYIFLDQNHWIYLAKAFFNNPHKSQHELIPNKILSAVKGGDIRIPLNILNLIELLKNERPERRKRLAEVFEIFSQGCFFASWSDILQNEIFRAVYEVYCPDCELPKLNIFGNGVLFSAGHNGRSMLMKEMNFQDVNKISWLIEQPGALYSLLTIPDELNRAKLKDLIKELCGRDVLASENLRTIRKPYAKNLHRRAQYAGYTLKFESYLQSAFRTINVNSDDFLNLGLNRLMEFWSRVPSLDVDCELSLYRDSKRATIFRES